MKKNKITVLSAVSVVAVLLVLALIFLAFKVLPGTDYSKAYSNTENLKKYTMGISTIITLKDGENNKQTCIDQVVKVKNKGKDNMVYSVNTVSNSTDENNGTVTEETGYIYKDGNNYHSYPGVNYKMPTTKEAALDNIKGLENIISVPYEKMMNVGEEKGEYVFEINSEDASAYVNSMIEFATAHFENVNFAKDALEVTAKVEGKYITERSFFLTYDSYEGQSFAIEIYVKLIDTDAEIEELDESKYASIMGN